MTETHIDFPLEFSVPPGGIADKLAPPSCPGTDRLSGAVAGGAYRFGLVPPGKGGMSVRTDVYRW